MTVSAPAHFEPFTADIVARAVANPYFREVLSTGPHAQVVVMSIPPAGEIGEETHPDVDQILVVAAGTGVALLDGRSRPIATGSLVHVPAGTRHNVRSDPSGELKLYTIYAPPQHAPGTIHRTKAEADAEEASGH